MSDSTLCEIIKRERTKREISLSELARRIDIAVPELWVFEKGNGLFPYRYVRRIARALELDFNTLNAMFMEELEAKSLENEKRRKARRGKR